MKSNDNFDELARRKLAEQRFPFEEAHWQEAQRLLRTRRRRRFGIYLSAALLALLGTVVLWPGTEGSPIGGTPDQRTNSLGTGVPMPAPVVHDSLRARPAEPLLPAQQKDVPLADIAQSSEQYSRPEKPQGLPVQRVEGPSTERSVSSSAEEIAAPASTAVTMDLSAKTHRDESEEADTTIKADGPPANPVAEMIARTGPATEAGDQGGDPGKIDPRPYAAAISEAQAATSSTADAPLPTTQHDPGTTVAHAPDTLGIAAVATTDSLITPKDTASAETAPSIALQLLTPRSPWEVTLLGGPLSSSTRYTGEGSADLNAISTDATAATFGAEVMHMGRHFGIGTGVHASTYAERIDAGAAYRDVEMWRRVFFLQEVDTMVFVVTDTIVDGSGTRYTGVSTDTSVLVLRSQLQSTVNSMQQRTARTALNLVSYIEVPLLLDAHAVHGRWSFGVIGGPTISLLSGRRGTLPDPVHGGYGELEDRAFRSVMLGWTARVYARFRMGMGWSIGLEPLARGQFGSAFEDPALTRRTRAFGTQLGLTYRLR